MLTEQTTYQQLAAPFEVSDHARVNKGGSTQTYAPWTSYVERLNGVLGKDWSFRVIREGFTETECWVLGEIAATIEGETIARQQYGCEPILSGGKPKTDLLKTAASDAVKKAASLLGVGLYLSVKEEREAIEAEMRAAVQAEAQRQAEEREANRPKAPASMSSAKTTAAWTTAVAPDATPETTQQRWARLVDEAARTKLPTLGIIKAIDPKAVGEEQLRRHAERLEARLAEVKALGAA